MIVWINGPFGVGKTSAVARLIPTIDGWRAFDPEEVGFMVRANLRDYEFTDFQQLDPWRSLVPTCLGAIKDFTGENIVAVQTVIVQEYWEELLGGLKRVDPDVRHVVLSAEESTIRARIEAETELPTRVRDWRLSRVDQFLTALSPTGWLHDAADLIVDTTNDDDISTASKLAEYVRTELAEATPRR